MSVITKDLGIATAYGYAKSKGYTGTEEEFAELMASYADVAQQAEAAAQDAEDAKDAAVSAKNDAQSAQAAAESAQTAAAGSAQTASTKATEASNSAQAAFGSATAAGNSATAAAGSASTAQTAAQTATNKASEASSSASAASTAKTGAETARTGAQTAQTAAETAQENAEAAAASVSASAAQIEQNTADIGAIKNDLNEKADKTEALSVYIVETETGSIASFTDGADGVPVKDLTVAIVPVQSGSGDPSPSNVRPISGWTGANVTRVGKNFIPNIPSSFTSGTVLVDFGKDIKFDSFCFSMLFSGSFANIGAAFIEGKDSANNNTILITPQAMKKVSDDTALTANTVYTKEHVYVYNTRTFYASKLLLYAYPAFTDASFAECQFEEGTRTAYEPYQGDTVSVDWTTEAGTVYGGTLDVTTGVLTVDTVRIALSSLYFYVANYHYFYSDITGIAYNTSRIWSDTYKTVNSYYTYNEINFDNCSIGISQSNARIAIRDDSYSDVASFVASLTDKYIVYGLATPQTYQLTPEEVKTILGQNNIFADTGNVTVQYRADTKLYIDKVVNA